MTHISRVVPVRGTDTEYLGEPERLHTSPVTHHGVPPVTGQGEDELSPRPATPEDFRPLRTYTEDWFGLPVQFWLGSAAMLAIVAVMLL